MIFLPRFQMKYSGQPLWKHKNTLTHRSSQHIPPQQEVKIFSFFNFLNIFLSWKFWKSEYQAFECYLISINTIWSNVIQMSCWCTVRGFHFLRWVIFWIHNFVFSQGVIHKLNQSKWKWSQESKWRRKLFARCRSWSIFCGDL